MFGRMMVLFSVMLGLSVLQQIGTGRFCSLQCLGASVLTVFLFLLGRHITRKNVSQHSCI